jgi:proline iminopeptidase
VKVLVNGVRLFVEVVGTRFVPEGPRMVERPTLILLHGGPGADHSIYRPDMDRLADVAQLVYVDHRGNGRSEGDDPAAWNLAQWGDDVRGLADALGIERPIVYGASFGGMVALSYAVRHPGHAAALILACTAARGGAHTQRRVDLFEQLGGPAAGALARRRLIGGDTSLEVIQRWRELCVPVYSNEPDPPEVATRMVNRPEVTQWFSRADGELASFDLRPAMAAIAAPVLLMGGELDPMLPIENLHDIAAALPRARLQTEVFAGCRHMLARDDPERFFALMRRFIAAQDTPA